MISLSLSRVLSSVTANLMFTVVMASFVGGVRAEEQGQGNNSLNRVVSVQGSAVVEAPADQGILTIQVVARDANLKLAKQQIDQQIEQLTEYLRKKQVKRADISNALTRIRHEFKTEDQQIPYFVAEREIKVLFRHLADYPEFMEYAASLGNLEVQPIALVHSNSQQLYNQALQMAFNNAKTKAEILAQQSQARLGKVIIVREQSQAPRSMAAMSMRTDYAVEIGTQTVNAEVSVEFQLLEH